MSSCSGDAQPAPGTAGDSVGEGSGVTVAAAGAESGVRALDNRFLPDVLVIDAGTTVVWDNGGRNDHNIVPVDDDGRWGVGVQDLGPGDAYRHAFTSPGEYPYFCTLHGTADFGMVGRIVVTD